MRTTLLWFLWLVPLLVIGKPTNQTNEAQGVVDNLMERFEELKMVIRNVTTSVIEAPINGQSVEVQVTTVVTYDF